MLHSQDVRQNLKSIRVDFQHYSVEEKTYIRFEIRIYKYILAYIKYIRINPFTFEIAIRRFRLLLIPLRDRVFCFCRYVSGKLRVAQIVLRARTRRHLTLALNFEFPSLHLKKKRTLVTWRKRDDSFRLEVSVRRWFSSKRNRTTHGYYARRLREKCMSPFNRRIPRFYSRHGHRRIRCQSPRSRENIVCASCARVCLTHACNARTHHLHRVHVNATRKNCRQRSCVADRV